MNVNESSTDRWIRGVLAIVLLVASYMVGMSKVGGIILLILALIAGFTAVVGFCPLYRLFNFSTKK
ncbi:YgaP family membrane protein [Corynebacterium vitaeruminis]|uniref:Inner membrane protein YgaP-like transmembrane domain-containing protein n=1 Tax=Corynebacterium vitaeruminis DSM 20294 TaxID=1224164 RepID=W5XZ20_9CORY|nr:DUF2892 domain-containing protein [Corynebacterium vitaeruminis]AHI21885.1 hypothetical protein B843_02465 [Corynebacterium vitaeruminis DSM 20294]